jgi:hypothetical protein
LLIKRYGQVFEQSTGYNLPGASQLESSSSYPILGLASSHQQLGRQVEHQQQQQQQPRMLAGFDANLDEVKYLVLSKFIDQVKAGTWEKGGEELGSAPAEYYLRPSLRFNGTPGTELNNGGVFDNWQMDTL